MVQFRSIKEYSHRNKNSTIHKNLRAFCDFLWFSLILIFVGPNPFWNKILEIKILQLDVTLPPKIIIVFW